MSRVGRKPLHIPAGINLEVSGDNLKFTGSKGTLVVKLPKNITLKNEDNVLVFERKNDLPEVRALHGLVRRLSQNAVDGLLTGFKKELQLVGTGYRVATHPDGISLSVGYSHPVIFKRVEGVTIEVEGQDKITVSGIDRQLVGQVAANIRIIKKPEPYKGKGIRYVDEIIIKKQGKTATKAGA
jgi:large subunit ribosomal protein L6